MLKPIRRSTGRLARSAAIQALSFSLRRWLKIAFTGATSTSKPGGMSPSQINVYTDLVAPASAHSSNAHEIALQPAEGEIFVKHESQLHQRTSSASSNALKRPATCSGFRARSTAATRVSDRTGAGRRRSVCRQSLLQAGSARPVTGLVNLGPSVGACQARVGRAEQRNGGHNRVPLPGVAKAGVDRHAGFCRRQYASDAGKVQFGEHLAVVQALSDTLGPRLLGRVALWQTHSSLRRPMRSASSRQ